MLREKKKNYHNDDVRWNPAEPNELLVWNIVQLLMIDCSECSEINSKDNEEEEKSL